MRGPPAIIKKLIYKIESEANFMRIECMYMYMEWYILYIHVCTCTVHKVYTNKVAHVYTCTYTLLPGTYTAILYGAEGERA